MENITIKTPEGDKVVKGIVYNEFTALTKHGDGEYTTTHIPSGLNFFNVPKNRLIRTKQALRYLVSIFKSETYPDFMKSDPVRLSNNAVSALRNMYHFLSESCDDPSVSFNELAQSLPTEYFNIPKDTGVYIIRGKEYDKAIIDSIIRGSLSDASYVGFCLNCGNQPYCFAPDANDYICPNCSKPEVVGAETLALML